MLYEVQFFFVAWLNIAWRYNLTMYLYSLPLSLVVILRKRKFVIAHAFPQTALPSFRNDRLSFWKISKQFLDDHGSNIVDPRKMRVLDTIRCLAGSLTSIKLAVGVKVMSDYVCSVILNRRKPAR